MAPELSAAARAVAYESKHASISINRPVGTVLCLCASDSLAVLLALLTASLFHNVLIGGPATPIDRIVIPAIVLTFCCFVAARLYPGVTENPIEELRSCVQATIMAFLSLWSATYFVHDLSQSRLTFVLGCMISVVLVPLFRSTVRSLFSRMPWWGCPVAILGFGFTGKRIFDTLTRSPHIGLRVVAVLDDNPAQYAAVDGAIHRGPLTQCLEMTREHRISHAIVCMPSLSRMDLLSLLDRYSHCFGQITVIPDLIGMSSLGIRVREMGGVIGLEVTRQLLRPSAQVAKRLLDLALAAVMVPLLAPALLVTAALIKLESPGPVFYWNERVGFGGRKFKALKLRSMVVNGDEVIRNYLSQHPEERRTWQLAQKLKRDPRITRIGRIIRKTSLDEVPQLWNVLKGEMSVVGPRPFLESQVGMYGANFNLYKMVRPGITGLWQVSGRNNLSFAERSQLDAYTIQNWSVWMDLYILARTVTVVLTARGAY